ncbi:TPA_asm: metalloprotease [Salmonella enterica subsp. enterica serovar Typhi str. CT18]|nr:metalloprotease [Salmonella enterica subsp. enterica serovar Typhi str. CT18]
MKIRALLLALGMATVLTGCQNMDSNGLLSSGAEAFQAYTLSDAQVKALSDQSCQELDSKAKIAPASSEYTKRLAKIAAALGDNINGQPVNIAPASSEYTKRLAKIAAALGDNINGQPVNYKVYETKDVNAFAMANGCIRVYSGLMDMMTDNEVEAVIGHEMGHVALGHVKKGMQVALGTNAVRVAAASAGGVVGSLSQSQLGDLGEKLVNSQFSQRQESEADDYSYDLLRKRGISPAGLATSFEKLAKLEAGRQSSMFDDHPASAARAQHVRDRMSADGIK